MYLAELRGKLTKDQENKEDILTSNVFSFFKYSPRDIFLYEFISDLGLMISKSDARNAEFLFWPSYEDNTEPDLVIIIGKYYLLFEAKFRSGFGEEKEMLDNQLVREIEGGILDARNFGKQFCLVAITAHYNFDPTIFADVPQKYQKNLMWVNWQQVAILISSVLEKEISLPNGITHFADDLYSLLVRKKLRPFKGTSAFNKLRMALRPYGVLFFSAETARYRGDFIGFETAIPGGGEIGRIENTLFYSKAKTMFSRIKEIHPNLQSIKSDLFFGDKTNEKKGTRPANPISL